MRKYGKIKKNVEIFHFFSKLVFSSFLEEVIFFKLRASYHFRAYGKISIFDENFKFAFLTTISIFRISIFTKILIVDLILIFSVL